MGLCIEYISGQGPEIETRCGSVAWLVVRFSSDGRRHLQGIMTDEETAVAICVDDTYLIGPVPVGVSLPFELVEWAGCYFPLRKK